MVIAYMLKFQSIDVQGERLMKEDVVPKTSLVSMVRATVTLTKNVKETLCVETTTVNSLLPTSIPRTTVVSCLISRQLTTLFMVSYILHRTTDHH